jgi:hypothetical protein
MDRRVVEAEASAESRIELLPSRPVVDGRAALKLSQTPL